MTGDMMYGLVTGILFGFLLQKGRVIRYDKQIGALRLIDMTIVKFMLTAIVVGMIGTYALVDLGLAKLSIKPMIVGAIVIGGLIFGVGWGLFGYCPGTSLGAVGEGRWMGCGEWPACWLARRSSRDLSPDESDGAHMGKFWQNYIAANLGRKPLVGYPSDRDWEYILISMVGEKRSVAD